MQNNVVCLVDPQRHKVKETYEYSAFGEERIYDQNGNEVDQVRSEIHGVFLERERTKSRAVSFLEFVTMTLS